MVKKEKILKINIYDSKGKLVVTSKLFSFPKVLFKTKGMELVSVKSRDIGSLKKGDSITVIFECFNGDRVKCASVIEKCTGSAVEFKIDDGEVMEERRSSFKVATRTPAYISKVTRGDMSVKYEGEHEIKATILDINLGGVLLHSLYDFKTGDVFTMFMLDVQVEIQAKILRSQNDTNGVFKGYGCQFVEVTSHNEELISKFIVECQRAERERKLELEEMQADA